NVVIDHVTANWATDENMSIWGGPGGYGVRDVTISNCLIAEGKLYGLLIGSDSPQPNHMNRISIIRNLFAHNPERNPRISNNSNVFLANNLAYNSGRHAFTVLGGPLGPTNATFIGNHYIGGADSRSSGIALSFRYPPGKYFVRDCLLSGRNVRALFNSTVEAHRVPAPPIFDPTVSIVPAADVRKMVLEKAGARPTFRDSVEKRIVHEVETETGAIRNTRMAPGWPPEYGGSTLRPFDPENNPHGDDDGDGYTNVEEILHRMAAQVAGG
ncbi:MAG: hypothetical protein JXB25_06315, partial [Deltaproteobacteria bacterium]|nr:hypothetical protein [Deltaproteobacteria bacterium]